MRIFGADLRELAVASGTGTIVALDAKGAVATVARVGDLPALAREASTIAAGDPFLLAVDVPVAGGATAGETRPRASWGPRRVCLRLAVAQAGVAPAVAGP